MKNRFLRFLVLPTLTTFMLLGFSADKTKVNLKKDLKLFTSNLPEFYSVEENTNTSEFEESSKKYLVTPEVRKNYTAFKEAIGFKESQGKYHVINDFGYLGKYQFGAGTLTMIGVYNTQKFLNSSKLQEKAFYANAARNKWLLRNYIEDYAGDVINGIKITPSGILAAAHLGGAGSVQLYLSSGGKNVISDAFGSTIAHYLKDFAGYDVSFIKADLNAKVEM